MIITNKLSKKFEDFVAVDGVNLEVGKGEVLALLGPNGAGKTTTIRMLTSLLRPTSGFAEILGYDVTKNPKAIRSNLGVLSENHGIYNRMPAKEYLDFFGQLYGMDTQKRNSRINILLTQFGLMDSAERRVGEYSKGMRQKLALARSLIHDPAVLLLDEPTSAMDPESARLVRNLIQELKSSKRTILICTHNLAEAEELADRIAIIRKGKIVASGTTLELRRQMLGPKIFEARFAQEYDLVEIQNLATIADFKLVDVQRNFIQFTSENPNEVNPQVLDYFHQIDVQVVYLHEVTQSLERIYLQAVSEPIVQ